MVSCKTRTPSVHRKIKKERYPDIPPTWVAPPGHICETNCMHGLISAPTCISKEARSDGAPYARRVGRGSQSAMSLLVNPAPHSRPYASATLSGTSWRTVKP